MAFFNYATMQMAAKIVYYGPGLCGKTTNLQYIYNKTSAKSRGEMVSLETESDRTLFFDLLPLEVGVIAGFKTRFQLYTVPGQVFYSETRRMVLKGVDGIVFVADSQIPMREPNIESLKDLEKNLKDTGVALQDVPLVFQYNKRDLSGLLSVEELERALNRFGSPYFEASAVNGAGVFDTLKGISRLTLQALKTKIARPTEPAVRPLEPSAPAPRPAVPGGPPAAPALAAQATPAPPVAHAAPAVPPPPPPPPAPPPPEVEFDTRKTQVSDQELAKTAPKVKTVATSAVRVASELDRIRESLLGPILAPARPKVKDLTPALEDIKKESQAAAAAGDVVVEVPPDFLEDFQGLHMEIHFSNGKRRKTLPGGLLMASSQLQKTHDGWVVRLKFSPKRG